MKKLGVILLFLACFFLLLEWQERDYEARGETAQAVVTGKDVRVRHRSTGARTSRDYFVSYRFSTPDGEVFEGRSDVSRASWDETPEGGSVTVEYKRDFPGTSRIAGQVAGAGFWWKASALLALLGIASLVISRRREAATAAGLRMDGLAPATMPDGPTGPAVHRPGSSQPAAGPAGRSRWQLAVRSPFLVHAILTVVGAMLCLFSLPSLLSGAVEPSDWLFAVIGAAMLGIGGSLARREWSKLQRDWRLLQDGAVGEATVTAVEETRFSINRVRQWRISYRYMDAGGRAHEGRSYYLRPEEASGWQVGDKGRIRFDSRRPADSVWAGRTG